MPIAIIKTGGKQYIVSPGKKLKVEKLDKDAAANPVFEVLLVGNEDGTGVKIGSPAVSGANVGAKTLSQGRHKKIFMLKYKPKKRYRLRKGHKQPYTEVEITNIR
ncbi:MAG: 50S ribosomal protein L21 [bacterium]|nr:50S ribosomal protein L21 [bacterium]